MQLAPFPRTSPWFSDSLFTEMTRDEIAAMEPADGDLLGIAESHRRYYRATIIVGQTVSFATGFTAAQAVKNAQRVYLEGQAA